MFKYNVFIYISAFCIMNNALTYNNDLQSYSNDLNSITNQWAEAKRLSVSVATAKKASDISSLASQQLLKGNRLESTIGAVIGAPGVGKGLNYLVGKGVKYFGNKVGVEGLKQGVREAASDIGQSVKTGLNNVRSGLSNAQETVGKFTKTVGDKIGPEAGAEGPAETELTSVPRPPQDPLEDATRDQGRTGYQEMKDPEPDKAWKSKQMSDMEETKEEEPEEAEAGETEAGEAGEAGGDAAEVGEAAEGAEAATEAAGTVAASDWWNPIGIVAGLATLGLGIYEGVETAEAANKAAELKKQIPKDVPKIPQMQAQAGRYIVPVQNRLTQFN
jgi:hypothetical protein